MKTLQYTLVLLVAMATPALYANQTIDVANQTGVYTQVDSPVTINGGEAPDLNDQPRQASLLNPGINVQQLFSEKYRMPQYILNQNFDAFLTEYFANYRMTGSEGINLSKLRFTNDTDEFDFQFAPFVDYVRLNSGVMRSAIDAADDGDANNGDASFVFARNRIEGLYSMIGLLTVTNKEELGAINQHWATSDLVAATQGHFYGSNEYIFVHLPNVVAPSLGTQSDGYSISGGAGMAAPLGSTTGIFGISGTYHNGTVSSDPLRTNYWIVLAANPQAMGIELDIQSKPKADDMLCGKDNPCVGVKQLNNAFRHSQAK